jgi:hypothetical protein
MDRWAGELYGDPCRECSFDFSIGLDAAVEYVEGVPQRFAGLVNGASGDERHPDLAWSVSAYVCHVADNLRIWAERLAGSAGGVRRIAAYDENLLAAARGYRDIALVAALWSLQRSGDDWLSTVRDAPRDGVVLIHPERGEMLLEDITRANAHDSFHHAWDIRRTIGLPR